jgi:hypothetical protein
MKIARPVFPPALMLNSVGSLSMLNTMPVGAPWTLTTRGPFGGGGNGWPAPLKSSDFAVPFSATHHGLPALDTSPQGLMRFESVLSDTRLCCS